MKFLLFLTLIIFIIGLIGIFQTQQNVLIILMSIELRLVASTILLINTSYRIDDILGQILALVVLTIAASESAIALAIFVTFFKLRHLLTFEVLNLIKG